MLTKLCTTITILCAQLIFTLEVKSQSTESLVVYDHRWTYEFSIAGVQDHDDAKYPSAIIHKFFKVLPDFDVDGNRFSFECKQDKSLIEFESIFEQYEFELTGWIKVYSGRSSADEDSQEAEKDQ